MMVKILVLLLFFGVPGFAQADDFDLKGQVILTRDLEIGDEDKDDYLFANPTDIAVDKDFNIFVLDLVAESIRKFSKSGQFIKRIGRKGEGPGEFTDYAALRITLDATGNLIVLERFNRRIHIFKNNGDYIKTFVTLHQGRTILTDKEQNMIILEAHKGKMFHVYNQNGKFIAAFGDLFTLPGEFKTYKTPGWRVSFEAFYSPSTGEIYTCHPFKYEIWAFTPESSRKVIGRQSDFFVPIFFREISGEKWKFRSIFPFFIYNDLAFVTLGVDVPNNKYVMEIYKNMKYQGFIKVKSHLRAIDSKGRLYFSEPEKVVRYKIKLSTDISHKK